MGFIIAIEGIDGSGKTVQHNALLERLRENGLKACEMHFPAYKGFFGKQIGSFLKGEGLRADRIDSKSMCLWFALDRLSVFKGFDEQYDVLLINRYVASNAVYQSIRDIDIQNNVGDIWDWVKALEHEQLGLPKPDLYILLDAEPLSAQGNIDLKGEREYINGRDVYEAQFGLLNRARQKYIEIASRENNFAVISCMDDKGAMRPIDEIHNMIFDAAKKRMGNIKWSK